MEKVRGLFRLYAEQSSYFTQKNVQYNAYFFRSCQSWRGFSSS